jgi:hypothetical protein
VRKGRARERGDGTRGYYDRPRRKVEKKGGLQGEETEDMNPKK